MYKSRDPGKDVNFIAAVAAKATDMLWLVVVSEGSCMVEAQFQKRT